MSRPGARDARKEPGEKSRLFSFRLHPDLPDEKTVIQQLDKAATKQGGLRRWIVELLIARSGKPAADVKVSRIDAESIVGKLDKIMAQLRSGIAVRGSTEAQDEGVDDNLSDEFLVSLDRFLDVGMSADADPDPDEYEENE